MQSPPQTHPPLLNDPAPYFWTPLLRDIQKWGAGSRRRGVGLGAQHYAGLGRSGFFWPTTSPARAGYAVQWGAGPKPCLKIGHPKFFEQMMMDRYDAGRPKNPSVLTHLPPPPKFVPKIEV